MDTSELTTGPGVPLRWNSIPSGGVETLLVVASCNRNRDKLLADGHIQLKKLSKVETFKNKALLYDRRKRIHETALARTKP